VPGLCGESGIDEVNRPVTAITGSFPGDKLGATVRVLGDQDGDSLPELLLEASWETLDVLDPVGRTYLIKGSSLFGPEHDEPFIRGDSNLDGDVNISDPIAILGALFLGSQPIVCQDAADANDDGTVNISDPIRVLNFLFLGGPSPPSPYPEPGADPSSDGLGCRPGRKG